MNFTEAIQLQIDRERAEYRQHPNWEFKERTPSRHFIGDFISAVMVIDNEADALEFYRGYIDYLEIQPDRTQPAKTVADANIGWCFGEGMSEERKAMWSRCTTASHPIFGRSNPTPEEAFAAGVKAGAETLKRS